MTEEQLKEFALIGILHRYYNEENKLNKTTDTKQKEIITKRLKELDEYCKEIINDIVKL